MCGFDVNTRLPELATTVGDALLAPHRSYLKAVTPLLEARLVKGMAHITGGGITENLPRVLPWGCAASVDPASWTVPPVFRVLQERGAIATDEMFRAFNMGIGLIVICSADAADLAVRTLRDAGETGTVVGHVVAGNRDVQYTP